MARSSIFTALQPARMSAEGRRSKSSDDRKRRRRRKKRRNRSRSGRSRTN